MTNYANRCKRHIKGEFRFNITEVLIFIVLSTVHGTIHNKITDKVWECDGVAKNKFKRAPAVKQSDRLFDHTP